MKLLRIYLSELFLLTALILIGFLLVTFAHINILFSDILIVSVTFSILAAISILVFFRGQTKAPDSQTFHTLVSISLKFLLELIFALLWFIVAKKTLLTEVLLFFVLYLALTLFSLGVIIKTLKNKVL